ncbi:MAG: hydroxymethylbilane synthase [Candidatus Omnitrophica bacterium]|nr:hydroxymethylbilane synthase [Candidatus Omnitrophota bacterium]
MPLSPDPRLIVIATRGSALALAQTNLVLAQCTAAFPQFEFQIKIIKTTGDKLQTAALARPDAASTKGLFTKELESALLEHQADMAVHSLKDLPTDLPNGLGLGAVCPRADARDVLIYRAAAAPDTLAAAARAGNGQHGSAKNYPARGFSPGLIIQELPQGATIATSSTRRQAQLLALRPDLKLTAIRGNVGTRLQKLADKPEVDAIILAKAGLERLGFRISPNGRLHLITQESDKAAQSASADLNPPPPKNSPQTQSAPSAVRSPARRTPDLQALFATVLELDDMLPCVGQGAIAIELRDADERLLPICQRLNHSETLQCVSAERAFLHAMGGGCQSPVAAYAELLGDQIRLRAVSFRDGPARRVDLRGPIPEALALGKQAATRLA